MIPFLSAMANISCPKVLAKRFFEYLVGSSQLLSMPIRHHIYDFTFKGICSGEIQLGSTLPPPKLPDSLAQRALLRTNACSSTTGLLHFWQDLPHLPSTLG